MNVKLLRRVKKHILEEPRRFAMGTWQSYGEPKTEAAIGLSWNARNPYENEQKFPECGTIACIGGWAEYFEHNSQIREWGGKLISASLWPDKFYTRYAKAKTARTRAKIAAERIDHFIATKGAE